MLTTYHCTLFSSRIRVTVRIRIRFCVFLFSGYAHAFTLLSVVIVTLPHGAIQVLMEYGGIYLDLDVLVTRPFDELRRQFTCTIGREQETKACGSVIVCSRTSPFLLLWVNSYIDDYRIEEWAYNTGQVRCL